MMCFFEIGLGGWAISSHFIVYRTNSTCFQQGSKPSINLVDIYQSGSNMNLLEISGGFALSSVNAFITVTSRLRGLVLHTLQYAAKNLTHGHLNDSLHITSVWWPDLVSIHGTTARLEMSGPATFDHCGIPAGKISFVSGVDEHCLLLCNSPPPKKKICE